MPFKAVQLCVVSVAISNLDWHSAVSVVTEFFCDRQTFQPCIAWFVNYFTVRFFCRFFEFCQKVSDVIAIENFSVFCKGMGKYRFYFHKCTPDKHIIKVMNFIVLVHDIFNITPFIVIVKRNLFLN